MMEDASRETGAERSQNSQQLAKKQETVVKKSGRRG
jgi:hypothetical protein